MGLDIVELIEAVEDHFAITIHDEDASKILTVGDLHRFILGELNRLQRAHEPAVIFAQLREVIVESAGVPPEEVVPGARFVEDLNLD